MCLAIPLCIMEILENDMAIAGEGGNATRISLSLLEENVAPGDFVLVHAGFAISFVDPEEARETLRCLSEMAAIADREEAEPTD
jgi:hydrogenase expression/formation protein HypC